MKMLALISIEKYAVWASFALSYVSIGVKNSAIKKLAEHPATPDKIRRVS